MSDCWYQTALPELPKHTQEGKKKHKVSVSRAGHFPGQRKEVEESCQCTGHLFFLAQYPFVVIEAKDLKWNQTNAQG